MSHYRLLNDVQRARYHTVVSALVDDSPMRFVKFVGDKAPAMHADIVSLWGDRPRPTLYEEGWDLLSSPKLHSFVHTGEYN